MCLSGECCLVFLCPLRVPAMPLSDSCCAPMDQCSCVPVEDLSINPGNSVHVFPFVALASWVLLP